MGGGLGGGGFSRIEQPKRDCGRQPGKIPWYIHAHTGHSSLFFPPLNPGGGEILGKDYRIGKFSGCVRNAGGLFGICRDILFLWRGTPGDEGEIYCESLT